MKYYERRERERERERERDYTPLVTFQPFFFHLPIVCLTICFIHMNPNATAVHMLLLTTVCLCTVREREREENFFKTQEIRVGPEREEHREKGESDGSMAKGCLFHTRTACYVHTPSLKVQ